MSQYSRARVAFVALTDQNSAGTYVDLKHKLFRSPDHAAPPKKPPRPGAPGHLGSLASLNSPVDSYNEGVKVRVTSDTLRKIKTLSLRDTLVFLE